MDTSSTAARYVLRPLWPMGQMYLEGPVACFRSESGEEYQCERTDGGANPLIHDGDQGLVIRSGDQGLVIRSGDQGLVIRSGDTGVHS
jgi:hypothetical protein